MCVKKDICVFLTPFIDELKILRNIGVEIYDQSLKKNYNKNGSYVVGQRKDEMSSLSCKCTRVLIETLRKM